MVKGQETVDEQVVTGRTIKVVVQNLQKRPGLASKLVQEYQPDVLLAQEIDLSSESSIVIPEAYNISKLGYGTAIYCSVEDVTNVRRVACPHAEFGGFIYKKATVANYRGVQFVTFHGYNGSPFRNCAKLVDHVKAVLAILDPAVPCLFAGDFNTWAEAHIDAVTEELGRSGFQLAYSWPYPGRELPLDHAFVRGVRLEDSCSFHCQSDHLGAVLTLSVPP